MKKGQVIPRSKQQSLRIQQEPLLVSDIAQFLSGLAKLQDEGKTGNPELGEGLRELVRVLRPYADCHLIELGAAIQDRSAAFENASARPRKSRTAFSPEFESQLDTIGLNEVEVILNDSAPTKGQIVELGFSRFGISRSSLERLNKRDAADTVRAALENEKSLDVISQEAARAGNARAG